MVNINFDRVAMYGPLLHEGQCCWVFYGMYKAFLYKKYNVFWTNNEKQTGMSSFLQGGKRILFFVRFGYEDNVPLNTNAFYILYRFQKGVNDTKFDSIPEKNKFYLDVYKNGTHDNLESWKNNDYIRYSLENRELYFPLATELLPNEIEEIQKRICVNKEQNSKRMICFFGKDLSGSLYGSLKLRARALFYDTVNINNFTMEDRIKKCIDSHVTCVVTPDLLLDNGIIDHKVFQVISYGGFPTNNSQLTIDLFDGKLLLSQNPGDFIDTGTSKKKSSSYLEKWELMEYVKNNHTFVKRLETIFYMLLRLDDI